MTSAPPRSSAHRMSVDSADVGIAGRDVGRRVRAPRAPQRRETVRSARSSSGPGFVATRQADGRTVSTSLSPRPDRFPTTMVPGGSDGSARWIQASACDGLERRQDALAFARATRSPRAPRCRRSRRTPCGHAPPSPRAPVQSTGSRGRPTRSASAECCRPSSCNTMLRVPCSTPGAAARESRGVIAGA